MAIRFQPREPDICEGDPFKNDLLDRRESVEVLTSIIGTIEGPCVLAVDAAWGAGKTTFLRMWSQYLRNNGFPVTEFNAWETDFAGDPFVALSSEIANGLEKYTEGAQGSRLGAFREAIRETISAMSAPLLRIGASAIPFVGTQVAKELETEAYSAREDPTLEYLTAKGTIADFKSLLSDIAISLAESREGKPLVLVIDELDRCRPSYAVALLEAAKHLFLVDRIVFVLGIDRGQLAHSVKVLYGDTFDAEGYLQRFFDVDYRLPSPKRDDFIKALLRTTGISSYLEELTLEPSQRQDEDSLVHKLLFDFFAREELSVRRIAQAVHRLGLVLSSLSENKNVRVVVAAAVAVILRTIDVDLYRRFIRNEVSDLDVVEIIVDQRGRNIEFPGFWPKVVFESYIIFAAIENRTDDRGRIISGRQYESPLMLKYRELTDQSQDGNDVNSPARLYVASVLQYVRDIRADTTLNGKIGFREAVNRLELLSADLGQE